MKILFISDFGLHHASGGAQVSNQIIADEGSNLGHEITFFHFDSFAFLKNLNYDVLISSNLEAFYQLQPEILNFICSHPNHVRLEHDSCLYLSQEDRQKLFQSSKINFFLSDFHISFFKDLYGDIFSNVEIVYDPIDTSIFKDEKLEKVYDVVYAGYIHPLKGILNLLNFSKQNPERRIDIFGWGLVEEDKKTLLEFPNIKTHEKLSLLEIAEVFKRSKYIYHNPEVNEPFCRMVGEALLCGCELVGAKDKIGSYLEFSKVGQEEFAKRSQDAPTIFWRKMQQLNA